MHPRQEQNPAAEALRERISSLSAAILRTRTSLDLGTVLQEAVDSARALTGARYGGIATVDIHGMPDDFVTSGITPEQKRQMVNWQPDGMRLFKHLRGLPEPVRLPDLPEYVRSLGFSSDFVVGTTYLGTPMRHRGEHVGNFFVSDKEGGREFTEEDEEILLLFAAQAAAAIDNARTYREERRARADLEALVETSPVGVAVFDAKTGYPETFNREARRLVEALGMPGHSPDEFLAALTSGLARGHEAALGKLTDAETLRGAEVELPAPDGRTVRMLINSTPIRSGDGEIESVVVTMQDLAALEELERLRVEFLGMVSHELRTPLTSIKGSTTTILNTTGTLDRAELRQFIRIIDTQADHMAGLIGDLLDAGRIESGTLSVDPEVLGVAALVERARTTFLSSGAPQAMRIDLPPDLPPVMADERRIVQVLNNLFANAARHSPETSTIHVGAVRNGAEVAISVLDEGQGIHPERLPHLFRRYADTDDREHGAAGFGLGLVICRGLVEAHGGRIHAESAGSGRGTRFTFTLPAAGEEAAGSLASESRPVGAGREPTRVLVVDDDPEMLSYVRDTLQTAGYAPLLTADPQEVSGLIRAKRPDLVLLDLMLPGTDGIALMEKVPELSELPVIFISGYGQSETVARALESGSTDYIVKPFSPTELVARARAALRGRKAPELFVSGDLAIDYKERRVAVAGRPLRLTVKEYELLRVLSMNAGRVVTYASLRRQVWANTGSGSNESARDFVKKLRRKLGDDPAEPAWIVNERGVGYRMPAPGER